MHPLQGSASTDSLASLPSSSSGGRTFLRTPDAEDCYSESGLTDGDYSDYSEFSTTSSIAQSPPPMDGIITSKEEEWENVFNMIDLDQSGSLSLEEISFFLKSNAWACKRLGLPSAIHRSTDGESVLRCTHPHPSAVTFFSHLPPSRQTFQKLDVDSSGTIDMDEFLEAMKKRDVRRRMMLRSRKRIGAGSRSVTPVIREGDVATFVTATASGV